jgi:hypothetical protein
MTPAEARLSHHIVVETFVEGPQVLCEHRSPNAGRETNKRSRQWCRRDTSCAYQWKPSGDNRRNKRMVNQLPQREWERQKLNRTRRADAAPIAVGSMATTITVAE